MTSAQWNRDRISKQKYCNSKHILKLHEVIKLICKLSKNIFPQRHSECQFLIFSYECSTWTKCFACEVTKYHGLIYLSSGIKTVYSKYLLFCGSASRWEPEEMPFFFLTLSLLCLTIFYEGITFKTVDKHKTS